MQELLKRSQIGRLAVVVAGRPDIYPVNYLVHEDQVIFKTAEGSKLTSVMTHHEVAFEIDGYDEGRRMRPGRWSWLEWRGSSAGRRI